MRKLLFKFTGIIFFIFVLFSCKKPPELPVVNTVGVKSVGINSATAFGNLTGLEITAKGFCWDTLARPDLNKSFTDEGAGSESFSSVITNLLPNKKYYLRAYAKNETGITFGDDVSFFTQNVPVVETNIATVLSYSQAYAGGQVSANGHSIITSGICYDTLKSPDISKKIVSASGGIFYNVTLNSLREKTVYYYRAYATFSFGTVYGAEKSFTTTAAPIPLVVFTNTGTVTDIDGVVYKTIKIGNQTWMAENLKVQSYNDGSFIPKVNANTSTWVGTSSGALGYYNNNSANYFTYGGLYNYFTIEDVRGLAPGGWHIPTNDEWQTLITTLNNANPSYSLTAVQQLFSTSNWLSLSCTPNNYSNMNLLASGFRSSTGTDFDAGISTGFWTMDNSGAYASVVYFDYNCFTMFTNKLKNSGYAIRCVKD